MSRVDEAKEILRDLGLPPRQQNDNAAYTLLAFAGIGPTAPWQSARAVRTNPHGVIEFARTSHGKEYAENTRETIRRQAIHQFVQAGILLRNPDDPSLPTNSPRTHYALSDEALAVVCAYGTSGYVEVAEAFRADSAGGLAQVYALAREQEMVPVTLPDGSTFALSPGVHNELQRAIVEELLPRFTPGANVIYLGDTADKTLVVDKRTLETLGIPFGSHDKLPDVVAYDPGRGRLILVEAVTSHGPVSPKRRVEIERMLKDCPARRVYISAFPDFSEYKRHATDIAWETEVWIADIPSHLLHYDGEKFVTEWG
jgi:type II restriction enzyme